MGFSGEGRVKMAGYCYVKQDEWDEVRAFIKNLQVTGNGRITYSGRGKGRRAIIQINGVSSGGSATTDAGSFPALTTGAPTAGVYPVAFYEDGKNEASTGTGTAEVLNLSISETLPTGTWIVCHPTTVSETGGGTP
jgi:hypothetical protein